MSDEQTTPPPRVEVSYRDVHGILGDQPQTTEGPHIRFVAYWFRPGLKTARWGVETKEDKESLGEVRWFGRWRQYAFFPAPDCVFEQKCMREISDFLEELRRLAKTLA